MNRFIITLDTQNEMSFNFVMYVIKMPRLTAAWGVIHILVSWKVV